MASSLPPRPQRSAARLGYGVGPASVLAVAAAAFATAPGLSGADYAMLLLLTVLAAAAAFGIGPGLVSALAAALSYNLLFIEPRFTLHVRYASDLATLAVFFVVASATGWLAGRVRDNERRLASTAGATNALLEASRALARAGSVDEAAAALAAHLGAAVDGAVVILVREGAGLRLAAGPDAVVALAPDSLAAAEAALAGAAPDADGASDWRFAPLDGVRGRVGVAGWRTQEGGARSGPLADALMEQGGVVLERAMLATAAAENEALREADRLRASLLNSISHDFRTPLASILGSATTLSDYEASLGPAVRRDLLRAIQQDAQRLNAYVGSLLDMARLEAGALRPAKEWTDMRDMVGSAVRRLTPHLAGRRIEHDFADRLSMVMADPILLEQALLNVLENAALYTPDGGAIRVAAHEDARHVTVAVDDQGPGIPPEALADVFDKFKRLRPAAERTGGLGLGLSITKGFVEAMGGRVAAISPLAPEGGTRFVISLPKSAETPPGLL